MSFEHPVLLLLCVLAPLAGASAWRWVRDGSMTVRRGWVLFGCLFVAVAAAALAAAGPSIGEDEPPSVAGVVLVDVSASRTEGEIAEANDLLTRAAGHPALRSILAYAGAPRPAATPLTRKPPAEGTDTERALRAARTLLADSPAASRRVWLLTDGMDTAGDVPAAVAALREAGIRVDVTEPRLRADVAVQQVDAPSVVRRGQRYELRARVSSDVETPATVVLESAEGEALTSRTVALAPGERTVALSWKPDAEGPTRLTVRVEGTEGSFDAQVDARPENDSMQWWVDILRPPKTLLVSEDGRAATALMTLGIRPHRVRPGALPTELNAYASYELVVLDRVTAESLGTEHIEALGAWVRNGGSVVAFPGPNGLAKGSSAEAVAMRRWLPLATIDDEKVEPPPLALMFVLDRSDSMGRERKWEVAARTTASAHEDLNPKSTVGVLTFSDFPDWVVRPTTVEEASDFAQRIRAIRLHGGTDMFPALKEAYQALAPLDARLKHVVLLSDGVSLSRIKYNEALLRRIRAANITVSTVAMGSEADTETMAEIARRTGGRYWFVANPDELPRIFAEETRRSATDEAEPEPLQAWRLKNLASLDPVNPERGAWSPTTRARSRATSETLWQVDVADPVAEGVEQRPLLARARFGRGRVIALAAPWRAAEIPASRLMGALVRSVVPESPGRGVPVTLEVSTGAQTVVDAVRAESGLLPPGYRLELLGPSASDSVEMEPVAGDRARVRLVENGAHLARLVDAHGAAVAWATLPAHERRELLARPAGSELARLARISGGSVVAAGELPGWLSSLPSEKRHTPLRVPLGLLALALAAASVWARRPPRERQ